jgi:phage terminase Nu1 subunit (DNA packaging protein)
MALAGCVPSRLLLFSLHDPDFGYSSRTRGSGVRHPRHIGTRVALYLRHEAQLEQTRQQRHSGKARAIAERALLAAQQDQTAGFDWQASFAELEQRHQEITSKL